MALGLEATLPTTSPVELYSLVFAERPRKTPVYFGVLRGVCP